MQDHDVETLLLRYRPVGPPADLHARLAPARRAWPWAAAAAVLLAITLGARAGVERLAAQVPTDPAPISQAMADLAQRLGGDEAARQVAEFILLEQQMQREGARAR